jgi:subtilisin family serine protease
MTDPDDIYEVKWNSTAWERAIRGRKNIASYGDRGNWVLYRPGRVLVRTRALRDRRVSDALKRAGADRARGAAADVAAELKLTLFRAPDTPLPALVQRLRRYVAASASLDHVQLPGPNRVHGDDLPVPTQDPGYDFGGGGPGEGISVLVLDTGCMSPPPFAVTMNAADAEVPDEDHDGQRDHAAGHGTHVAGIVAHLAPGATIVARRLLKSPVGEASDLDVAAALLNYDGADVINCSFGAPSLNDAAPIVLEEALATLPPTTVVVAAAGNAGLVRPNFPAACHGVIGVGAVGSPAGDGNWLQTDFSNHGAWVDCCAPGVAIPSTFVSWPSQGFQGFATWTGTSMASPHVAGTIAALATKPGQDVQQAATLVRGLPPHGTIGALVDAAKLI